jgi:hypothetical protein
VTNVRSTTAPSTITRCLTGEAIVSQIHQYHPLITCALLEANGYRQHANDHAGASAATFCRTMRMRTAAWHLASGSGSRARRGHREVDGPPCYVVTFFCWDLAFLGRSGTLPEVDRYLSTEATMRLVDGHRFCVDYKLDDRTTLANVETFYADVYRRLDCLPDPEAILCAR